MEYFQHRACKICQHTACQPMHDISSKLVHPARLESVGSMTVNDIVLLGSETIWVRAVPVIAAIVDHELQVLRIDGDDAAVAHVSSPRQHLPSWSLRPSCSQTGTLLCNSNQSSLMSLSPTCGMIQARNCFMTKMLSSVKNLHVFAESMRVYSNNSDSHAHGKITRYIDAMMSFGERPLLRHKQTAFCCGTDAHSGPNQQKTPAESPSKSMCKRRFGNVPL